MSEIVELFRRGFKARNTQIRYYVFSQKPFYFYIYISTIFFNYTHMKMINFSWPSPNMSSIGEVCDMLGTVWLSLSGGNHWATGVFQLSSTSMKGGLISFPLFLVEGNAILPMTPRAGCVSCERLPKIMRKKLGNYFYLHLNLFLI